MSEEYSFERSPELDLPFSFTCVISVDFSEGEKIGWKFPKLRGGNTR
jgi:hypothetical protein